MEFSRFVTVGAVVFVVSHTIEPWKNMRSKMVRRRGR